MPLVTPAMTLMARLMGAFSLEPRTVSPNLDAAFLSDAQTNRCMPLARPLPRRSASKPAQESANPLGGFLVLLFPPGRPPTVVMNLRSSVRCLLAAGGALVPSTGATTCSFIGGVDSLYGDLEEILVGQGLYRDEAP